MKPSKAARCVLSDTAALASLLALSLAFGLAGHFPAAVSLPLILTAEALLLLPLTVMKAEKPHPRPRQTTARQLNFESLASGALAALLAYVSYLFVFARNGLSPAYMDGRLPLHAQAMTLALVTLVLCQLINLLLIRGDEHKKVMDVHLGINQKLLRALGITLFALVNLVYNPLLQSMFGTKGLDIVDWSSIIVGLAAYTGLRSLQRHTRQHTRHTILKLHLEADQDSRVVN